MRMEARRSALVLIDLQERLMPAIEGGPGVVERCAILLQAARRLDVPVLATRQYPRGLGALVAPFDEALRPRECHDKLAFSAFAEDPARAALRDLGRDCFVLAGVEAHVCVLQTALDLLGEGYGVAIVADAVSSRTGQSRELALARLRANGALIVNAEMVLFEWLERAGTDAFRDLSPLIR
ncbi:MAG: hydrolase [Proteobacteria bacterium]|nr:hydrolase [Pseudomonadota bacterium]MDA0951758.1 hydrolase [Pseudomonadota bacterium]MDA1071673.1 hydrolase [Pseudomonadota bacterium]